MMIKRIGCDQFAGLTDKELEFEKGLNIVIGANESGKSTMVDLIYQMLFKDVKLDGRSDSEFTDKYFPKKVSGPQGDVIDGVLYFETAEGTYKLKKEWEKGEGTCRLTLPDGTSIKGNAAINEVLRAELKHRAGVYSEIVFASQKRSQLAVESIMRSLGRKADTLSETRMDLASALTQAALETDGVSVDKIETSIKMKMAELIGRWDLAADAPEGGPKRATHKNAWVNGAGTIVKAYYEADEVRDKQADAENAERAVEAEKASIREIREKKAAIEENRKTFQRYRGLLGQISLLSKAIADSDLKLREQRDALARWPQIAKDIAAAKELRDRQGLAHVHDLCLKVKPLQEGYTTLKAEFDKLIAVDPDDLKVLRSLAGELQKEEGKLKGLDLVAKIKKLGQEEISVASIASGDALDVQDGEIQITEAVDIRIPGIMEMQLVPRDINVEEVGQNIEEIGSKIKSLYSKYGISSLGELQELSDTYAGRNRELDVAQMDLERALGESSWESVKAANDAVPEGIETEAEIKGRIADLCGSRSVDAFIGGLETTLTDYQSKYVSTAELEASIKKLEAERDANQQKLTSMDEIPAEFRGIEDPEAYDASLQIRIDDFEVQINAHNEKLSEAERHLGDKSAEEYSDELQEKEDALMARKAEYEHWENIYKVFVDLKARTQGNPVKDIEIKFREYLAEITDRSLKLDSMDEHMSAQLTSGSHALTYDILSEGTRDTISLAFRLAMLEHLYPDGDGLAIFDDPFTDMDPKRVEQACRLIRKFAENNQVIFVTCDEKYKSMGGSVTYM